MLLFIICEMRVRKIFHWEHIYWCAVYVHILYILVICIDGIVHRGFLFHLYIFEKLKLNTLCVFEKWASIETFADSYPLHTINETHRTFEKRKSRIFQHFEVKRKENP